MLTKASTRKKEGKPMEEIKAGKATIKIHGTPDNERLKKATEKFMKQVMKTGSKRGTKE